MEEAAQQLGMSYRALQSHVNRGTLASEYEPRFKLRLISNEALGEFARNRRKRGGQPKNPP